MIGWMTVLFFGAAVFIQVESKCDGFLRRGDKEALCSEWWENAMEKDATGDDKRKCVKLMKKKCASMINIKRTTNKILRGQSEIWELTVSTSLNSNPEKCVTYIEETEHSICWDRWGTLSNCDDWWKVAEYEAASDNSKKHCIKRILKHCKGMISKVGEEEVSKVPRHLKGYKVTVVTYKHRDGYIATYQRLKVIV